MQRTRSRACFRRWLAPALSAAGSVILYVVLTAAAGQQDPVAAGGRIAREGYGGEDRAWQIMVEGLEEEPVPVTVTVGARIFTDEQADDAFTEIMDTMAGRICGENLSLMEVAHDLELPSRLEDGIRLRWYSSDPGMLDSSGKVREEVAEPQMVTLTVEITDGIHRQSYELPVRLIPVERSGKEDRMAAFLQEVKERNETNLTEPFLILPEDYEGRELRYKMKNNSGYEGILLVGVMAAVLLVAREQSGMREKEKRRERELLLDYADVLSKLMVLTGAGLTIRNAWEKIARDYEAAVAQGRQKSRAAYEEMCQTCRQMQNGISESEAYREFGRRCRVQSYLKLSGLLEQNRRAGTKNLRAILQTEMADALEQRKNLALRLGEEAGTKLLMPLFLMLGIVMVMIMVPAMMTMG